MIILTIAALAAATPVSDPFSRRVQVQVRVSRAGLDLTTDEGRRILDSRIHGAIAAACAPYDRTMAANADARRCKREMTQDAGATLATLTPRPAALALVR